MTVVSDLQDELNLMYAKSRIRVSFAQNVTPLGVVGIVADELNSENNRRILMLSHSVPVTHPNAVRQLRYKVSKAASEIHRMRRYAKAVRRG